MKVFVGTHEFEVAKAEQYLDGVHLYNEDGSLFVIIENPHTIDKVEDGEIVVMERPEPSEEEDISALIVDHEYRLTLLELGIVE